MRELHAHLRWARLIRSHKLVRASTIPLIAYRRCPWQTATAIPTLQLMSWGLLSFVPANYWNNWRAHVVEDIITAKAQSFPFTSGRPPHEYLTYVLHTKFLLYIACTNWAHTNVEIKFHGVEIVDARDVSHHPYDPGEKYVFAPLLGICHKPVLTHMRVRAFVHQLLVVSISLFLAVEFSFIFYVIYYICLSNF